MFRDWIAKDIPVIKYYLKFCFQALKRRWWIPAAMIGFFILTVTNGIHVHSYISLLIGFMLGGYWSKPYKNGHLSFPPEGGKKSAA